MGAPIKVNTVLIIEYFILYNGSMYVLCKCLEEHIMYYVYRGECVWVK